VEIDWTYCKKKFSEIYSAVSIINFIIIVLYFVITKFYFILILSICSISMVTRKTEYNSVILSYNINIYLILKVVCNNSSWICNHHLCLALKSDLSLCHQWIKILFHSRSINSGVVRSGYSTKFVNKITKNFLLSFSMVLKIRKRRISATK
jgi:hypothetical protein